MYTYLGKLKKNTRYDKRLRSYLGENNITVVKRLKKLNLLIIQSEVEITTDDHQCFEILEKERNDFSI